MKREQVNRRATSILQLECIDRGVFSILLMQSKVTAVLTQIVDTGDQGDGCRCDGERPSSGGRSPAGGHSTHVTTVLGSEAIPAQGSDQLSRWSWCRLHTQHYLRRTAGSRIPHSSHCLMSFDSTCFILVFVGAWMHHVGCWASSGFKP